MGARQKNTPDPQIFSAAACVTFVILYEYKCISMNTKDTSLENVRKVHPRLFCTGLFGKFP